MFVKNDKIMQVLKDVVFDYDNFKLQNKDAMRGQSASIQMRRRTRGYDFDSNRSAV